MSEVLGNTKTKEEVKTEKMTLGAPVLIAPPQKQERTQKRDKTIIEKGEVFTLPRKKEIRKNNIPSRGYSRNEWIKTLTDKEVEGYATGNVQLNLRKYRLLYFGGISAAAKADKNMWSQWLKTNPTDIVYIRDLGENRRELLVCEEVASRIINEVCRTIVGSFWCKDYKEIMVFHKNKGLSTTKEKMKSIGQEWSVNSVLRAATYIISKIENLTEDNYDEICITDKNLIKEEGIVVTIRTKAGLNKDLAVELILGGNKYNPYEDVQSKFLQTSVKFVKEILKARAIKLSNIEKE